VINEPSGVEWSGGQEGIGRKWITCMDQREKDKLAGQVFSTSISPSDDFIIFMFVSTHSSSIPTAETNFLK
jgi:hypothetical protein